jgi:rSAM/selenodomain-associated transferase 2
LALGLLLLLLPTLHPWYLVLIAPFLVFFPSRAWLYLQVAVVFTFPVIAVEAESGIFQEISWLKWLEYAPFYALLFWGLLRDGYILRERSFGNPKSISAIVPTLNEENSIGRCLATLKNRTALKEIIVADGGSDDRTRRIAVVEGARVVESRAGRGIQIQQGIQAASGDVVIILHADCLAVSGTFEGLIRSLKNKPHVAGGAFRMQFEPKNFKTRLIAALNNMRTLLTGISFGDQAQFFRKEAIGYLGDLPAMMLMEDVELALRLKESGPLVFLHNGIVVSDRRWSNNRFTGNLLTVLHLFTRYLIERRWGKADWSMHSYYERYYH